MRSLENSWVKHPQSKILAGILLVLFLLAGGIVVLAAGLLALRTGVIASPLKLLNDLFALDNIHLWWYISRASGLMGYLLLWLSTLWGFAVSSKVFDSFIERMFTYDFHEYLSLLGLGFVGLHALVLTLDRVEPFSLTEVLFPFISGYRPFWTGIGIIAFYLSALVTVTFYIRSKISMKTFRAIHYLGIAAFAGALFHSLYAGTDSALTWVQGMYWGTFLSTVFFLVYWLGSLWLKKSRNGRQSRLERAKASR